MAGKREPFETPERRSYSRGTVIFKEGDAADVAFIVESGRVEILKTLCGKRILLGTIRQWGIFGELAVLDGNARMATAVTVEDTICLVIHRDAIGMMLDNAPQGLSVLITSMANTIRQAGEDLAAARFALSELGQTVP